MSRIKKTFIKLREEKKKALVAYIVAGDPDISSTLEAMRLMVLKGVNLIELGVPFSDPMAEGLAIQKGHQRALQNKTSLGDVLELVKEYRKTNNSTPIILMGYLNPFLAVGSKEFVKKASISGIDGILFVDMPPEESNKFTMETNKADIDIIRLISPTTSKSRAIKIVEQASGFVYYISLKGVTGADSMDTKDVENRINDLRQLTDLPVVIGFGIKDGKTVTLLKDLADGVVVGSALVDIMGNKKEKIEKDLSSKIIELSVALNTN